ncbi:UxaA family hydrolase [Fuerstiella marisgermanici]|uniref:Altronate dehydratase n=1 Tax=Fuerstiella marisgermanici TaxID=1891926 RepID=A0A1P8WQI5_9PLAN|nr:altronate dehydratase family protein [Fuerstiella marisgermanici]APZ96313.1 Altronate dehydratase [Fuerstiella marisgermanici]
MTQSSPTTDYKALLVLHPDDNVAVTTQFLPQNATCVAGSLSVRTRADVPPGHKVALNEIDTGAPVIKYGQIIGYATTGIQAGEWVHVHNVVATKPGLDYAFSTQISHPAPSGTEQTFLGFRRRNGTAGTRNYVAIISTVNCSATTAKYVAKELSDSDLSQFRNIDGIIPLVHKSGCALAFDGDDHRQLNRTLAGFANHPNIGAVIVLGLGCETAQATHLEREHGLVQLGGASDAPADQPLVLNIQEVGGVRKTVARAVEVLRELLPIANDVQRVPIPVSELKVAMECGGSDGNSGITANPAVGVASDMLVAHGATSILSETPEIYGAEHMLTRRAINREVGEALLDRIHWWEEYAAKHGGSIDNNPSVGNKNGGLTTIYEKSLGAIAKGGTSPLMAVYRYAEPVTQKGFVIMDSPGFDPASITGKVAGGAQVVVFTTGRGSCYGCKPSPTIKVATNTPMFERMRDDMDINAGVILDGTSVEEVGQQIFDRIIATASGQPTLSELQGIGDEEFCPWFPGPIF